MKEIPYTPVAMRALIDVEECLGVHGAGTAQPRGLRDDAAEKSEPVYDSTHTMN